MSELNDLIKSLQMEVKLSESTYVYYDKETGSVLRLSGQEQPFDENEDVLAVPHDVSSPILTGEKKTSDYIVIYDIVLKQKVLKEKSYEDAHKEASTMCYQLPIIKNNRSGHMACTEVYDGVEVYIWFKDTAYKKDHLVWYEDTVYKLLKSNRKGQNFSKKNSLPFIEDVQLTNLATQSLAITTLQFTQEYIGLHIDIWYNDLEHLAGQHVWIGKCVYRIIEDQPKGTEFNPNNAEMLVSNVLLYKDSNKSLDTITHIQDGDVFLEHNKIYSASLVEKEYDKTSNDVIFYTDQHHLVKWIHKNDTLLRFDTTDTKDYSVTENTIEVVDQTKLKNGSTILLGKKLYKVQLDKEYDIIITQDKPSELWTLALNPATLKFLQMTNYDHDDVLYFSITAKHDPNILYRALKVSMSELNKIHVIPFEFENEKNKDVSLYTAKYFDSYAHEVIE